MYKKPTQKKTSKHPNHQTSKEFTLNDFFSYMDKERI